MAKKTQRTIRMSIVHPITVEMTVETSDEDADENSDWSVASIRRATCEVTVRSFNESCGEDEFEELALLAFNAKEPR